MMAIKKKTVFGIILLLLFVSGIWGFNFYRQPLGPALELPTSTQPDPMLTIFPTEGIAVDSPATEILPPLSLCAADRR
jgi:hypothetical protein